MVADRKNLKWMVRVIVDVSIVDIFWLVNVKYVYSQLRQRNIVMGDEKNNDKYFCVT